MLGDSLLIIIIFYITFILILNYRFPELRWKWNENMGKNISFPKGFMWGTATAAHQVEGKCHNNWSEFEKGFQKNGEPNIKKGQKSGMACNHWNLYPHDVELIKELGVNHYRFSVEWSKIQPSKGKFDQEALDHYSEMIKLLLKNDIIPVLTLHHFTHPVWFDELGAFEKEENVGIFVEFCKKVFQEYSHLVKYWCTINEPGVVAVQGYFSGMFPPGKQNPQMAAIVLKNLLLSHVETYKALKKMKNGSSAKIGLVKNINQFDPWRRWHILDWVISYYSNSFFNESTITFLKTGKFKVRIPGILNLVYENMDAKDSLDFFGLNYYSHNHLKFKFSLKKPFDLKYFPQDTLTDMPYVIYGEGMYRAIKFVSKMNVPIIITENGIADAIDDRRELYIKKYLFAISKAISDGYDVRGYFYWSLMDNFEWAFGYDMKFGLYSVNHDTQVRKLRNGAKFFIDVVKVND